MKQYLSLYVFLILTILQISCSSEKHNEESLVDFSARSTVVESCVDSTSTHTAYGYIFKLLPNREITTDTLSFDSKNNAVINYEVNMPSDAFLYIDDSLEINLVLRPNDTLFVTLNTITNKKLDADILFSGKGAIANEYELAKQKEFGYELNSKKGQLYYSNLSLSSYEDSVNHIKEIELNFLENFNNNRVLPQWFLKYETSKIIYSNASNKLNRREYQELILKKEITFPKQSKDFLSKIIIDNNDAAYTVEYYNFLLDYFSTMLPKSFNEAKSIEEKLEIVIPNSIKCADSLLTGNQRDIFKSREITVYLIDQDFVEFAERVLVDQKDKLQPEFYAFLENEIAEHSIIEPGTQATDFYLEDPSQQYKRLADFKGNLVLLNFWFPGCYGCKMQIPYEHEIVEKLKNEKFSLINVCVATAKEKWLKAIEEFDMKGINLYANENWKNLLSQNYNIYGYPHYTLIDQNGNIISNDPKRPNKGLLEDLQKLLN